MSFPFHGENGSNFCNLSLSLSIITSLLSGSVDGSTYTSLTFANPFDVTSVANCGGSSLNFVPSFTSIISVRGLNDSFPARANAITISGLAMKFIVSLFPSFLPGKFLLYDVTIVLGCPILISGLLHWPIHGPQAFAKTVPPISLRAFICPSLSIVALIISDPGVTKREVLVLAPFRSACSAIPDALDISSYEEFVQLPMRATE